jgi:hypothetical protein
MIGVGPVAEHAIHVASVARTYSGDRQADVHECSIFEHEA